jgi:hypothetical protein
VWIAVREVGIEANDVEQLADGLAPARPGSDPVHLERLRHDAADRHARIERRVRILEHDLHLPAHTPQILPR